MTGRAGKGKPATSPSGPKGSRADRRQGEGFGRVGQRSIAGLTGAADAPGSPYGGESAGARDRCLGRRAASLRYGPAGASAQPAEGRFDDLFGVKLTIVEPGGYWADLYTRMHQTTPLEAYAPLRAEMEKQWAESSIDSEPRLAAEAVMKLVDSDDPPLRLLLGSMVYDLAFDTSRRRMDTWAGWEQVSRAAEQAVPAGPAPR
jgi:hypothetical protein